METKVLTGDTEMLRKCEIFLEKKYGFPKVFLTNSCTMALEMAAVLLDIGEGDEVIMPSYTYVSTANAFALRGAKIVFADSKGDHPGIDESKIEKLITGKTKAIVLVHYAGTACDMKQVKEIAGRHKLMVIEDAAQCIDAYYNDSPLGSIGDIGCFSFHETKNIHCGEGGFISINNPKLIERAETLRNKGTNRSAFLRGEVNRYEWTDLGFSSVPTSLTAAFLLPQLKNIDLVQKRRNMLWKKYEKALSPLAKKNMLLPLVPGYASNNAHMFYLVCRNEDERAALIKYLKEKNIQAVFHYQALHRSPYFKDKYKGADLSNADRYSECLVRLPLFYDLSNKELELVCRQVLGFFDL
ncbi:MAG: TDP-4-keto-6-deoxy-D-glucose transaminase [Bacteroidetes bacterium]|nr:TDP-4-keto-6-deoxy-D-glucose transaminase [Bacteroidota bacterium]